MMNDISQMLFKMDREEVTQIYMKEYLSWITAMDLELEKEKLEEEARWLERQEELVMCGA